VATDNLFAVLHYDRGEIGVFEYPTIDTEQMAEGEIMIKPFSVSTSTHPDGRGCQQKLNFYFFFIHRD